MSQFSDYLESAILNSSLRAVAFPIPSGIHLALFTTDPTDLASGTEVSGGWYARQNVGLASAWTAPADDVGTGGKKSSNQNAITYPAVTGAGLTVTHIGVFDAASGGNMLYHSPLAASKTLNVGDVLQFAANAITIIVK